MPERGRTFDADRPGDEGLQFPDVPPDPRPATIGAGGSSGGFGITLPFRTRLLIGLIASAIGPLAVFGAVVFLLGRSVDDATIGRVLLLVLVFAAMIAVLLAYLIAADLTAPLRAIAAAVERTSAGDLSTPIVVPGEDELAQLAESHNRLAADLERRNRELGRILQALESGSPRDSADFIAGRAAADARSAFGMIDAEVRLVDPSTVAREERIPGESLPVRAVLRVGGDQLGVTLTVENRGRSPLAFTAALHSYLRVHDVRDATIVGLRGTRHRESGAPGTLVREPDDALRVDGEVDRVYVGVPRTLTLWEPARSLEVAFEGFPDAVIWNPGETKASALADMEPGGDRRMVCVEAAAVQQPVTLEAGARWSGTQRFRAA